MFVRRKSQGLSIKCVLFSGQKVTEFSITMYEIMWKYVCVSFVCLLPSCLNSVIDRGSLGALNCNHPKLLIVSFDGFRWDYLDKVPTPNFGRVYKNGVRAKWIKNAFVTKTFPNHYSIVSGLYEESHGVVNNAMYDPVWNKTFSPHELAHDCDWFSGEPIWVTNQLQAKRHKSGSYFWIGSDCEKPIGGVHPTFYEHYNGSVPFHDRADTVTSWFTQKNINLGLLYYHEPDSTGHRWGPDSPQMKATIIECDKYMGYLLDELEKFGLLDKVNLIVTSDHGMEGYGENNTVYLDDYVSPALYFTTDGTPFKNIWPKKGQKELVYKLLKKVPHINVYYKEDIPDKFHYKNSRRVAPIFIMADLGWQVVYNKKSYLERGDHGWSNEFSDMHPFFLARGPAFKKGIIAEPFNNVDIYPLMCHILDLKPAANNGSLDNVKHLLRENSALPTSSMKSITLLISTYTSVFIMCGGFTALIIIGAILQCRPKPTHIVQINPLRHDVHMEVQGLLRLVNSDIEEEEDDA